MSVERSSKTPYRLMVSMKTFDSIENLEKLDFILTITKKYKDRSEYINELIKKEIDSHPDILKLYKKINTKKLN